MTQTTKETPNILVVDDEASNRAVLRDILEAHDYQVSEASDGLEALRAVEQNPPDVILLDLNMPNMGGLDVMKTLKLNREFALIPVVIVTGQNDNASRITALKLGADDFLTKPPHMAELIARVRSLVKVKAYYDHMRDYQKKLEAEVADRTRRLQDALTEIQKASLETVYHLSRAAEFKDDDTAKHIRRISRYASALAKRIGLDDLTCELILYASPMHDVGKIGIPDHILLKPGKLTPQEWLIMKSHTTIGGHILDRPTTEVMKLAQTIALTHHEKWDGSGYPNGISGEQIPLAGRITAVVDVYDALTSRRPYKEPMPHEKAISILKEGRASHFDAQVLEIFLSMQGDLENIRLRTEEEEVSENDALVGIIHNEQRKGAVSGRGISSGKRGFNPGNSAQIDTNGKR